MSSATHSYALVFLQFLCIALLASPVSDFFSLTFVTILGLMLLADAVALALWALISMKRGTFRVLPEPSANAQLTMNGPYQWIRHPMYTAVLLAGLGAVLVHATLFHCIIFLSLSLVLYFKIRREETALLNRYPEYAAYRSHSKALVPFLY